MTGKELNNQWSLCLDFIRDNVSESVFDAWFSVIKPVSLDNGELTIQVPSPFVYEYLEQNCLSVIKSALTKVFGRGTQLVYSILTDKENNITQDVTSTNTLSNIKETASVSNKAPKTADAPWYRTSTRSLIPTTVLRTLWRVPATSWHAPPVRPLHSTLQAAPSTRSSSMEHRAWVRPTWPMPSV